MTKLSILFRGISGKLDKHETFCKDYACQFVISTEKTTILKCHKS